jgi:hypothetical protein
MVGNGTRVYGASDDLIEFEGDVCGEVGSYGSDQRAQGILLAGSDGTILEVKYGKDGKGLWGIRLLERGLLFSHIDLCTDETVRDRPHSDIVIFSPGLRFIYAAKKAWERVS